MAVSPAVNSIELPEFAFVHMLGRRDMVLGCRTPEHLSDCLFVYAFPLLSAMDRDCSVDLAVVPTSISLCALSVASAAATADTSARCSCCLLTEVCA